jgi:site-specific recombinase XerD
MQQRAASRQPLKREQSHGVAAPTRITAPAAKMPFQIHPQMLRHACGFKLAIQGVDTRALQHYLGHKNIQHTVRYTELSPDRFRDFWRD